MAMELSIRSLCTLDYALRQFRATFDALPGKEMSKLELYRVHLEIHEGLLKADFRSEPITEYHYPEGN